MEQLWWASGSVVSSMCRKIQNPVGADWMGNDPMDRSMLYLQSFWSFMMLVEAQPNTHTFSLTLTHPVYVYGHWCTMWLEHSTYMYCLSHSKNPFDYTHDRFGYNLENTRLYFLLLIPKGEEEGVENLLGIRFHTLW